MVLARENNTFFMGGAFQYAVTCYRQLAKLMDSFEHGWRSFHRFWGRYRRSYRAAFPRGLRDLGRSRVDSSGT